VNDPGFGRMRPCPAAGGSISAAERKKALRYIGAMSDANVNHRVLVGQPWVNWSLGALLILAFVLAVGAVVFFWEAFHIFDTPSIWGNIQEVKDKLDAYEKHASVLQALISALLFVTTFYSAGLGVFSYANARSALEDARRSAGEVDKIKADIRKTFPIFGDLDMSVEKVLNHFDKMFPDVDWSRGFQVDPQQRQRVLFYERALALFEFLNIQDFREDASQAYRGIGSYYGRKFGYDGAKGQGHDDDYQSAQFYLDKAVATHENVRTLNDRGALAMTPIKTDFQKAEECFEQSHLIDPDHQRALYNLAIIWHRRGKACSDQRAVQDAVNAFDKSIQHSSQALTLKRWQKIKETPYQADLRYNRACAYTRLASIDPGRTEALLKKATADLKHPDLVKAFEEKNEQLAAALRNDIGPLGDLRLLATRRPYAYAVRVLRKLI
jgi:tetratricopeptide (TPR) repeat protein